MANNLDSNITRRVMRAFIPAFEKQRVLTKTVNNQLFAGEFTPASGENVDIKRPHQYGAVRTETGDISSSANNKIESGKATATVQDYITVPIPWTNKEEALKLDQLEKILEPAARTAVTELETSFCDFMFKRAALLSGTVGSAIDAWADVANPMSLMESLGIPAGNHYMVVNPFTIQNLASVQTGLSADPSRLVQTAWEKAQIASPFAGLQVLSSNSLSSYTSGTTADRAGALTAAPTQTYLAHKDTMIQTLAVDSFTTAGTVKAGEMIEIAGIYLVHPLTKKPILDADGNKITWKGTVTADVTFSGGAGNLLVSGPAIYEYSAGSNLGQYDNIEAAIAGTEVVNILGSENVTYQPNLFYHKDAFAIAYVKIPKLFSTDTVYTSKEGISIRVSKYSDGDGNTQKIRFDILPAFACLNPFFAGKAWGLT